MKRVTTLILLALMLLLGGCSNNKDELVKVQEDILNLQDQDSKSVKFTPMDLTEAQKSQVRENIGAAAINDSEEKIKGEEIAEGSITADKVAFIVHDENTNFIRDFLTEKTYIKDGIINSTPSEMFATEKVFLEPGESYYYGGLYSGYSAFYDENDNVIETYNYGEERPNPFTVPDGTSYGRFTSSYEGKTEDAWISLTNMKPLPYAEKLDVNINVNPLIDLSTVENPCDYIGDDICVFSKCLCIGDSLTSGTMNADGSTTDGLKYLDVEKYSYPSILERLTGVEVVNMGMSGKSSAEWYSANKYKDLSGYDIAIIQLGVNDGARYGGWTETSVTAYTDIINKLKDENKNIKIFVSTIIPAISYSGDIFDEISEGIRNLVSSLKDENVILVDLAVYGHTKDSSAYNCGHLSAYGYYRLAKDYKAFISHYVNTNKEAFKEIQFIGTDYVSGY